jgi:hypothetical protein
MAQLPVLGFQFFMAAAQIVIICILHYLVCLFDSAFQNSVLPPVDLVQVAAEETAWEIMCQFHTTICSPIFVAVHPGCQ